MKKIIAAIMMFFSSLVFAGEFSNIVLKDFNGKSISFKNYEGKKTYVKLWASWCPACLYSLPEYAMLSKENVDFNVINVVFPGIKGEQKEQDFINWFSKTEFFGKFNVFFDAKGLILRKVSVRGYPYNVFLDSKGNVATTRVGVLNIEQIKDIMEKIK